MIGVEEREDEVVGGGGREGAAGTLLSKIDDLAGPTILVPLFPGATVTSSTNEFRNANGIVEALLDGFLTFLTIGANFKAEDHVAVPAAAAGGGR